jgi:hypothetical protein
LASPENGYRQSYFSWFEASNLKKCNLKKTSVPGWGEGNRVISGCIKSLRWRKILLCKKRGDFPIPITKYEPVPEV